MSKHESLSASQACLMYLVMCVIDYSPDNEGYGQALLQTLWVGRVSPPLGTLNSLLYRKFTPTARYFLADVPPITNCLFQVRPGKIGFLPSRAAGNAIYYFFCSSLRNRGLN